MVKINSKQLTDNRKSIGRIKPASRMTNQRLEIISFLQSTREHPTAEKIYYEIRKKLPKISLGTIYRNLEILAEKNLVKKFNFGENKDRFDGDTSSHHHFYCNRCRRVIDLVLPDTYQLKERVENSEHVIIENFGIIFKGKCNICR
jgi:Fe2+ or Zn2+ uptake regulation protein